MWTADRWKDFEVLDATNGERLERWGKQILVRPDPQVIWTSPRRDDRWEKANARYERSNKGGGHWDVRSLPESWSISYDTLRFHIKPFSFKHTGLFPEQAVNWDWAMELLSRREAPRVLNLFAYTGGATCAAAKAGAAVTHVDAARGMVTHAHENAEASGLSDAPIRWIVDDALKFTARELRRGNKYDAVILDPPSYGRGPKGEIWKIEEQIADLLASCVLLLTDHPLFFLLNSYTTGLQSGVLTYLLSEAFRLNRPDLSCIVKSDELGLPVTASGLILPCGASGRVEFP